MGFKMDPSVCVLLQRIRVLPLVRYVLLESLAVGRSLMVRGGMLLWWEVSPDSLAFAKTPDFY